MILNVSPFELLSPGRSVYSINPINPRDARRVIVSTKYQVVKIYSIKVLSTIVEANGTSGGSLYIKII